jgi:hypothetical protein
MLTIKKLADDLYTVEATPPEVDDAWVTPEPMSARKIIKQLTDRGCHTIDIADALNEQDPDWIAKEKGPYT